MYIYRYIWSLLNYKLILIQTLKGILQKNKEVKIQLSVKQPKLVLLIIILAEDFIYVLIKNFISG